MQINIIICKHGSPSALADQCPHLVLQITGPTLELKNSEGLVEHIASNKIRISISQTSVGTSIRLLFKIR